MRLSVKPLPLPPLPPPPPPLPPGNLGRTTYASTSHAPPAPWGGAPARSTKAKPPESDGHEKIDVHGSLRRKVNVALKPCSSGSGLVKKAEPAWSSAWRVTSASVPSCCTAALPVTATRSLPKPPCGESVAPRGEQLAGRWHARRLNWPSASSANASETRKGAVASHAAAAAPRTCAQSRLRLRRPSSNAMHICAFA